MTKLSLLSAISLLSISSMFPVVAQESKSVLPISDFPFATIFEGELNGKENIRFLLDTGAQRTVIVLGPNTADTDLDLSNEIQVEGAGGTITGWLTENVEMKVGPARLRNVSPIVIRWDKMGVFPKENLVFTDIILGNDVIEKLSIMVDHDNNRMEILGANTDLSDRLGESQSVKIRYRNNLVYTTMDLQVADEDRVFKARLDIDTGFSGTLELVEGSNRSITIPVSSQELHEIGAGGEFSVHRRHISEILIGEIRQSDFYGTVNRERGDGVGRNGSLGSAILNQFLWSMNLKTSSLNVTPRENPFPLGQGNIVDAGLVPVGGRLAVLTVQDGTRGAELGIAVGDTIISVDGIAVNSENYEATLRTLYTANQVTICWKSTLDSEQCKSVSR